MSHRTRPSRPARARLAGALLALTLLAAGCGGDQDPEPSPDGASEASDAGGSSDDGGASDAGASDAGASDGGGRTAAAVPADPYPVTPVPEGFEAPAVCNGEGTHLAEVDAGPAQPELPERAGESLTIELTGIEDDHAQLTASIGAGEPRPIQDATIGESVTLDLWTISITSICSDDEQVEFDLIN